MTPDRARAYGRVIKTVDELGPSKLLPAERDRIRTTADMLLFSRGLDHDLEARDALLDAGRPMFTDHLGNGSVRAVAKPCAKPCSRLGSSDPIQPWRSRADCTG